jgi:hypothetical protein
MTISLIGVTLGTGMMVGDYTNVIPSSLDIFSWAGFAGANAATVSRDSTTGLSPAGGVPFKMAVTGNDPYTNTYNAQYWNLATAAPGQTWKATVYVKASSATQAGIFIFGADSNGTYLEAPNTVENISTSWVQISHTYTLVNPSTTRVQIRLDGPDSGGTGVNIWWDQLLYYRLS